jgi:predicted CoA-binding protein
MGAKALWLQLAIVSSEARGIRGSAGMDYVEVERPAIVRRRLVV